LLKVIISIYGKGVVTPYLCIPLQKSWNFCTKNNTSILSMGVTSKLESRTKV